MKQIGHFFILTALLSVVVAFLTSFTYDSLNNASSNGVNFVDGNVFANSYSFEESPDTGLTYNSNTNSVNIELDGIDRVVVTTDTFVVTDSTPESQLLNRDLFTTDVFK